MATAKRNDEPEVVEVGGLKYLEDIEFVEDEGLTVPLEFSNLQLSKPIAGQLGTFNADGFPAQNLKSFLFIPLMLNPLRKMMYLRDWDGGSNPPDCSSNDGIRPVAPLSLNGAVIDQCAVCPLYGFGKNFRCHDKPHMVGLAYFPEMGDMLVAVRKDIPTKSIKAFNTMIRCLDAPVLIGDAPRKIPHWARIVRVGSLSAASNFGPVSQFTFEVLSSNSPLGPNETPFVPAHLLEEIGKMFSVAKSYVRQQSAPQLTTSGVAGMLPGGQAPVGAPPDTSATILQAEDEAEY